MTASGTKSKLPPFLWGLAAVVCAVLIWHFGASAANERLLLDIPLPFDTVRRLVTSLGDKTFLSAVGASLLHITAGFLSAAVIGFIGGVLSGTFHVFRSLSAPAVHLMKSVPVAAFIIVAWLWIPTSVLPTVVSCFMVVPIIWSHVLSGMESVDTRLIEMSETDGMSKSQIALYVKAPLVLSHFRTGCITGLGIAWKSGVAAEVVCNPTGTVGALLRGAKTNIDYEGVFAVTLAVVLLSFFLENVIRLVWRDNISST